MVSVGEIEKVRQEIWKKIYFLKDLNANYKKSIDKCYPAGISSNAYFISRTEDVLDGYKDHFTIAQYEDLENLKRQYTIQFRRLNEENVCECKQKINKSITNMEKLW